MVHDDSSNSQSDKFIIQSIQRKKGFLLVSTKEGPSFFVSALLGTSLFIGEVLTDSLLEQVFHEDQEIKGYAKALDLLARREESRLLLQQKLLKRGFDPVIVKTILDKLEKKGYLNNERFAEAWVRSRINRREESLSHLMAELGARGVEQDIARKVVSEALGQTGENLLLKRAVKKAIKKSGMTKEKLIRSLLRKGFTYSKIARIIQEEDSIS